MAITIPLFALRRGQTSGLESAIFNHMRGLAGIGTPLRFAATNPANLPEDVRGWIDQMRLPLARYPGFGTAMSARFLEESVFGLTSDADLVLSPNYFLPPRGPRLGRRAVIIHDLQHKAFPEHFGPRKTRWLDWQFGRTLRHADCTILISQFEREQAYRYFGPLDDKRITVVPNAIDWERFDRGAASEWIEARTGERFILSVAQDYPHKRLTLLVAAFAELARRRDDVRLIMVGRASAQLVARARDQLGEALMRRVELPGFVSDADLAHLYQRAALFALPSAYEGFGMPAVEAMGFGCPALVTGTAALPEVTLGRARYLPLDADAGTWAEEMEALLDKRPAPDAQLQMQIRGLYAPARIARMLVDCLGRTTAMAAA